VLILKTKHLANLILKTKNLQAVILISKDLGSRAKIAFAARYGIWRTQAAGVRRFRFYLLKLLYFIDFIRFSATLSVVVHSFQRIFIDLFRVE